MIRLDVIGYYSQIRLSKQIGTTDMKNRCHSNNNEKVSSGEYNPLERAWCRDQALNPEKAQIYGPYQDAFQPNLNVFTFGQAIYDDVTNEFIACIAIDISSQRLSEITKRAMVLPANFYVVLATWEDEPTVVAAAPNPPNPTTA
eukprot:CAMPEP_0116853774 /NCGR_PEP_ID=MMETSP0418-20121206/18145_1 /TAXON_ID=1158023 /ORGANISM="Astrosyne radiata, Strain 13vi08-1A" /LENGTH=143 /DNA_ID=CAMNT_0004486305 /DNA_START=30 /DNA_END=461 /DNA_ORIENTATION=-